MTREDAIAILTDEKERFEYALKDSPSAEYHGEAYNAILNARIKALDVAIDALTEKPLGTWRVDVDDNRRWDRIRYYCSECGDWQTYGETKFCPNCGRKMEVRPSKWINLRGDADENRD